MSAKINSEQFRHLLTPAIVELSQKIQTSSQKLDCELLQPSTDSHQYLKIENEALEHIGFLVLNVFNSILEVNYNVPRPEIASSILNTAKDTASISSTLSSTIFDLTEAENRCRLTMPHTYIEDRCKKAYKMVEKCRAFMNQPKRTKLIKAISDLYSSSSSSSLSQSATATFTSHLINSNVASPTYVSSTNSDLAQQFTLPIDDIHAILSKKIFFYKFDLFVTIFLVSILENVCSDILRLAIKYVSHQGKYNITKSDVVISVQVDNIIAKVLHSDNSSDSPTYPDYDNPHDKFEFNNLNDDLEDEIIFGSSYCMGEDKTVGKLSRIDRTGDQYNPNEDTFVSEDTFEFEAKATDNNMEAVTKIGAMKMIPTTASAGNGSNNSCDDVTSDSSTICAESVSIEQMNQRYSQKVRELVQEQSQYLQDLNVLRRIFVVLFKKCCYLFGIKLNAESEAIKDAEHDLSNGDQIETMFGNINDVYECSLRLSDLLEESVSSIPNPLVSNTTVDLSSPGNRSTTPTIMVGQQFWDLAEGDEFSVYTKYAECVTDFKQFNRSVDHILSNPNAQRLLQQYNSGLIEISKYLLPKLLMGSIYHLLYLTETVEYLHHCATDDEDKTLLKNTLDTLIKSRFELKELNSGYSHFCFKPIETSLRMFHAPQLFMQWDRQFFAQDGSNISSVVSLTSASSTATMTSNATPGQKLHNTSQALVANLTVLTQRKKSELENRVESFKWPSYINQPLVQLSMTPTPNEATVRSPYLFERSINIYRSTQPIQNGSQKMSVYLHNQTKLKIQKRYAYLFDGCLILTKRDYYGKNPNTRFLARYKQAISLDKCILRDCFDDDLCFELHVQSINNNSQGRSNNNSSSSNSGSTSSPQEQEYIVVKCDSSHDKYEWMSMFCYTQYKSSIDRLLQQMTEEQHHEFTLPIPPKGYIFDLPDSPETVVISDNHSISEATLVKLVERMTHHQHFNTKLRHEFLMCYREFCTSHELFELLTLRYNVPDLELDQATLAKFLSGGIIEREVHKRYRRKYQEPIRLNVINVIKHWIRYYSAQDFVNDPHLLQMLRDFSQHVGSHNQRLQQQLLNIMNKKLNGPLERDRSQENVSTLMSKLEVASINSELSIKMPSNKQPYLSSRSSSTSTADDSVSSFSTSTQSTRCTDTPSEANNTSTLEHTSNPCMYMDEMPAFESHLETSFPYDLLTVHPLELARQATLIEWEIFKRIRPNEFTTVGWMKKDQETKKELSPNLVMLMNISNQLTNWYTKWIVDTMSLDERVAVVLRLLDIAEYFDEMNNFSGMKEIFSALEMAAVIRLKTTIDVSKIEQHKMYQYLTGFFGDHDHEYFKRLKKCNPPCLPFLGSFLTIISKKKDYHVLYASQQPHNLANMTFLERAQVHLIGFGNWRLIVDCVTELINFQNISYNYRVHGKIRSFIEEDIENMYKKAHGASETLESDENAIANWLYERSLYIEPKDKPALELPRFNKYSLKPPPPSDRNNNKISNSNKNYSHSSLSSLTKTDSMHKSMNKMTRSGDKVLKHCKSAGQNYNETGSQQTSASSSSRNIFQKRSSINSTIQQLKLPSQNNLSSPSLSPSPSPSPTYAKYTNKYRNQTNTGNMSASSTVLSLVSTSASQMSSSQPTNSINAPFGSIYSPKSPTTPTTNSLVNANFSCSTNLMDKQDSRASGSICFNAQGTEKLSFSSADSSSSAPNSPPPNYDEVFDSSASEFVPTGAQSQTTTMPNKNCYSNKTFFKRIEPQLSTSMGSLKGVETHPIQQFTSPYKDQAPPRPYLKPTKSNQPSVFSFPYLEGQNEEIKMSSRSSSTDFFSTSSSMQSSPLLAPEEINPNKKAYNTLPPPVGPPVPPPSNFGDAKPPVPSRPAKTNTH